MTDYAWMADRAAESDVRYCNRCGQVGFHEKTQACDVCDYRPAVKPRTFNEEYWESLWTLIAGVRDKRERTSRDADTGDIVDAVDVWLSENGFHRWEAPQDERIQAALDAWHDYSEGGSLIDRMRAALRAASAVQGENR